METDKIYGNKKIRKSSEEEQVPDEERAVTIEKIIGNCRGVFSIFRDRFRKVIFQMASVASNYERSEFKQLGGLGGRCKPPPQWGPGAKPRNFFRISHCSDAWKPYLRAS